MTDSDAQQAFENERNSAKRERRIPHIVLLLPRFVVFCKDFSLRT
jgi:hypothetical protein